MDDQTFEYMMTKRLLLECEDVFLRGIYNPETAEFRDIACSGTYILSGKPYTRILEVPSKNNIPKSKTKQPKRPFKL